VCAGELRGREVRARERGAEQARVDEGRALEIGRLELRALELAPVQVGAREVAGGTARRLAGEEARAAVPPGGAGDADEHSRRQGDFRSATHGEMLPCARAARKHRRSFTRAGLSAAAGARLPRRMNLQTPARNR